MKNVEEETNLRVGTRYSCLCRYLPKWDSNWGVENRLRLARSWSCACTLSLWNCIGLPEEFLLRVVVS